MKPPTNVRPWHIALWTVQTILALFFGFVGVAKLRISPSEAAAQMPWVLEYPSWTQSFIGTAELLGALGLVLPTLLRILPALTQVAALALTTVMVLAGFYHAGHDEYAAIAVNAVLGVLLVFIAWGRWRKAPIAPR